MSYEYWTTRDRLQRARFCHRLVEDGVRAGGHPVERHDVAGAHRDRSADPHPVNDDSELFSEHGRRALRIALGMRRATFTSVLAPACWRRSAGQPVKIGSHSAMTSPVSLPVAGKSLNFQANCGATRRGHGAWRMLGQGAHAQHASEGTGMSSYVSGARRSVLQAVAFALMLVVLPPVAGAAECGHDGNGFDSWLAQFKQRAAAQGISPQRSHPRSPASATIRRWSGSTARSAPSS